MDSFGEDKKKMLCYAIIVILVILIVFQLSKMSKDKKTEEVKEHMRGLGAPYMAGFGKTSSGATQRFAGAEDSSTNRGVYSVISNVDIADSTHGGLSGTGLSTGPWVNAYDRPEHLTSRREGPNFWQIGDELGAYRRSQVPGFQAPAPAPAPAAEYMTSSVGDLLSDQATMHERALLGM